MNNQITAVDQNATGDQNAVVYQNAPVYQPVPVYQNVALYQNSTVTDVRMQQMINTNAVMDYAGQVALAQNMALRPSNTKKAYDSRQIEWRVCQSSQLFENGLTTSHQEDAAPDQVDIDNFTRISEPFTTAINQQISANNSNASVVPPSYALSRTIVTVTDLWREYSTGLTGCPSVRDLEQQFGASWRKGNQSRYFSRRNEIYKYIKDKAVKERITEEEVSKKLEERRRHIGVPIDKLRKLLKEELSRTRVELILPTG